MMKTLQAIFRYPMAVPSLALAAMVLLAGCASAPKKSEPMVDKQVNFSDYETYGWYREPSTDASGEPLSLVDTVIREAIAEDMQRKAYIEAPAGSTADLLIDYQAGRTEKVKSSPFRIGIGVGSYGSSGGASVGTSTSGVKNVSEGSLVIHAIDTSRNTEVWRSDVTRELGKGTVEPEVIKSVVAEVFADFPARTASP